MDDFPPRYNHKEVEGKWYSFWEENSYFLCHPEEDKKRFSIVIPPPNVTGILHIGHALNNTLQDILSRFKRMDGYDVLWLPGTDHAGIATENVVEKELLKKGVRKKDLGREKFLEEVWKWKEEKGNVIIYQLKRLGASCDWTRLRFTMDEGLSRAVFEAFSRLYKKGLIYKGKYIINWCPRCHTALSDLEVEQETHKGFLYYIRYPFKSRDGWITVATTRPETMLGDTAVAFHPDDERYKEKEGEILILPLLKREIPLISDKFVDPEFGTGAVKITPAHDFNDFLVAQRHNLPFVKVIDEDGNITEEGGKYRGLGREEARKAVLKDLEEEKLLERVEDYEFLLGRCYRCKTVVEPLISNQWFVKMKPLAQKAIEAVKEGRIKIIPRMWESSYFNWLENIRDWCISRQIWWGHRIPVLTCRKCRKEYLLNEVPERCTICGGSEFDQEDDVLDTWFSSALWPFSTLGWPEITDDLKKYYPTSVLVSAFDILFFWVARMIMMGLEFMNDVPFRDVYIHPLIRDERGEKMSKSRGNIIDPLEVMEKFGTDALRFTLSILASQGRDIKLSESKIESSRNFVTKLWNASRFIFLNLKNHEPPQKINSIHSTSSLWILTRLREVIKIVRESLESYEFDQASNKLYEFLWNDFCDWYVEIAKFFLKEERWREETEWVLLFVMENVLKLLHPFIPFVTEEIHSRLFPQRKNPLIVSPYPKEEDVIFYDPQSERKMTRNMKIIISLRNIRQFYSIGNSVFLDLYICSKDGRGFFSEEDEFILKNLGRVKNIYYIHDSLQKPPRSSGDVIDNMEIFVPLSEHIDPQREVERFNKKMKELLQRAQSLDLKLKNEEFIKNAPEEVVNRVKNEYEMINEQIKMIKKGLDEILS